MSAGPQGAVKARGALFLALALLTPAPAHAEPARHLPIIDQIVVHKAARAMLLYAHGRLAATIPGIQLGGEPIGAKHFQGDQRTPEGHYTIDSANENSAYHLALHISYPANRDIAYARAAGRPAGGAVFIHGQPDDWPGPSRAPGDWTNGCIALSNAEIEALWQAVPDGTPIDILP